MFEVSSDQSFFYSKLSLYKSSSVAEFPCSSFLLCNGPKAQNSYRFKVPTVRMGFVRQSQVQVRLVQISLCQATIGQVKVGWNFATVGTSKGRNFNHRIISIMIGPLHDRNFVRRNLGPDSIKKYLTRGSDSTQNITVERGRKKP